MQNISPISLIYGIDFSGSQDACKKIWICKSIPTDEGLKVQECWNINKKYGNISLNSSLEKLTEFIASSPGAVFGIDFPFGLPKIIVDENNWIKFTENFPENYNDPDEFRQKCMNKALEKTGKKELKRDTDIEADSPFCPYNLRIYKQTYYGINNVLRPLVMKGSAKILPMEGRENSKPLVFEICPASSLKDLGLYFTGYKGKDNTSKELREKILIGLKKVEHIIEIDPKVWKSSIENEDGDALDSVIAAIATYRGLCSNPGLDDIYKLEGYIYV